jgi:hypothetical protein
MQEPSSVTATPSDRMPYCELSRRVTIASIRDRNKQLVIRVTDLASGDNTPMTRLDGSSADHPLSLRQLYKSSPHVS